MNVPVKFIVKPFVRSLWSTVYGTTVPEELVTTNEFSINTRPLPLKASAIIKSVIGFLSLLTTISQVLVFVL
ncbi:hypothetical protein D3C77_683140 [compost metagenome]